MLIVVERCETFHHYYPIGVYTPLALTVTGAVKSYAQIRLQALAE